MTTTFDFDRLLESVLDENGPRVAPEMVVEAALATAGSTGQRRPIMSRLDRRSWPARRLSLGNPGTVRLVLVGLVMLLTLALVSAAIGVGSRLLRMNEPNLPGWTGTGAMSLARTAFTATLLPDGKVLVAGGAATERSGSFDSAEIYDPASGSWSATSAMTEHRSWHTATMLLDGTVLVTGGGGGEGGGGSLATAELYDPATGVWTLTGSMAEPRAQHVAVRLPDGKVLVAGGTAGSDPAKIAEIYDPETGTWSATGPMADWRASPTATLLPGGQVLVAGGFGPGNEITSAELFDPATRSWSLTGYMSTSRVDGTSATLLPNGEVLVVGGPTGGGLRADRQKVSSAELYVPATGSWTVTASMRQGQGGHTATLMPDGSVLATGGIDGDGAALAVTQSYDPRTASWTEGPPMIEPRYSGVAVPLFDGRILVMGGSGRAGTALSSAELYTPHSRIDSVVPLEYEIPVGSAIRLTSGPGSELVAFVSGPAGPLGQGPEDVSPGQEPKAWEAQGVVVGSAEEAWSHGNAGRFMLGTEPAAFLAGLSDTAGVPMGSIEESTLDGHPALTTLLHGTGGTDIHVTGHMQGLSGNFVLVTMPSRLTVADIDGTSVFVLTWARTADDLAAWLPTADRLIDSFHFPEARS